ncbi:MmcQ/YjbR family DNA-binding protein [Vibrio sp. Of14-4]|uniref:MmcQ/YjbR family DNA-binding protein n=1 Tax=Vibrio sp. Of14-4 TaxID=2724878 RepID=UPI001EF26CE2|nr:MmcQ/YjbR family DNA-binding protein [Vibrio sp. Of14-4]MCG7488232.1 MmcQ/YjbR family DNA-binding protein [Vibrio sp. Of14-4]
MDYDQFNAFCRSLPDTTQAVQGGNSHVWKINGKVFAFGGRGRSGKPAFSFKASDSNYEFLKSHKGYTPAPHASGRDGKWIQQLDTIWYRDDELKHYITESYRMVSKSKTKTPHTDSGDVALSIGNFSGSGNAAIKPID